MNEPSIFPCDDNDIQMILELRDNTNIFYSRSSCLVNLYCGLYPLLKSWMAINVGLSFLTFTHIIGCTMGGIFQKSSSMGNDLCSFLWKLGSLYLPIMASYLF